MDILTCAACGQIVNIGIWDNATRRFYCQNCLPPLTSASHESKRQKPAINREVSWLEFFNRS